jgi:hypothetical protein
VIRYRLYIDESGDHASTHVTSVDKRYLGVIGVAFQVDHHVTFSSALAKFKSDCCGCDDLDDPPILHREDVIGKRRPFDVLRDNDKARTFYSSFVALVNQSDFVAFAIVIDKHTHGQCTYRTLRHPYHYCLHVILEKYRRFLEMKSGVGDVLAESRGGNEDTALKEEYKRIINYGTRYCDTRTFRNRFTSKEIKIKKKEANIAGLQLADMIAFAATRDVLRVYRLCSSGNLAYLDQKIIQELQNKYYQLRTTGTPRINGIGRVILR